MTEINFLAPLDQPLNHLRLIDVLKESLALEAGFSELMMAVAFVNSSVIKRLMPEFRQWKLDSKPITAYFGIDQKITSKEALLLACELFGNVHIINHKSVTFHPKVYLFRNETAGRVILGSNNLTSGGLEMNFEAAVIIDFDLNVETEMTVFKDYWQSISKLEAPDYGISIPATEDLVNDLFSHDLLSSESRVPGRVNSNGQYKKRSDYLNEIFTSKFSVTRPKVSGKSSAKPTGSTTTANVKPTSAVPRTAAAVTANQEDTDAFEFTNEDYECFIIQIKPHHNGEFFLSKTAVNEKPAFFEYPFSGSTIPKNPSNPSYPQRDPDPIVNIVTYGKGGKELISLYDYPLNTVYYSKKSEIRVTCSPIVGLAPDYSVLIMSKPVKKSNIDYEMVIHTPDSPSYQKWVDKCTNKMPGGGKAPRAYGWL
jgi:HKD family nuclease